MVYLDSYTTQTCIKLKKEFVGCLNHLLNLIVKRFSNSKIIQQDDNSKNESDDEEYVVFDVIFDYDSEDDNDT